MDVLMCHGDTRFEAELMRYRDKKLDANDLRALAHYVPLPKGRGVWNRVKGFFSVPPVATIAETRRCLKQRNIRVLATRMGKIPGVHPMAARWLVTTAPQLLNGFNLEDRVYSAESEVSMKATDLFLGEIALLHSMDRSGTWLEHEVKAECKVGRLVRKLQASGTPQNWNLERLLADHGLSHEDLQVVARIDRAYSIYRTTGNMPEGLDEASSHKIRWCVEHHKLPEVSGLILLTRKMEEDPFVGLETFWLPMLALWTGQKSNAYAKQVAALRSAFDRCPAVREQIFKLNQLGICLVRELPDVFSMIKGEVEVRTLYEAVVNFLSRAANRNEDERHRMFFNSFFNVRVILSEMRERAVKQGVDAGPSTFDVLESYLGYIPKGLLQGWWMDSVPVLSPAVTRTIAKKIFKGIFGEEVWKHLTFIHEPLASILAPVLVALLRMHPIKPYHAPLKVLADAVNPKKAPPSDSVIDNALFQICATFGTQIQKRGGSSYLNVLTHFILSLA